MAALSVLKGLPASEIYDCALREKLSKRRRCSLVNFIALDAESTASLPTNAAATSESADFQQILQNQEWWSVVQNTKLKPLWLCIIGGGVFSSLHNGILLWEGWLRKDFT